MNEDNAVVAVRYCPVLEFVVAFAAMIVVVSLAVEVLKARTPYYAGNRVVVVMISVVVPLRYAASAAEFHTAVTAASAAAEFDTALTAPSAAPVFDTAVTALFAAVVYDTAVSAACAAAVLDTAVTAARIAAVACQVGSNLRQQLSVGKNGRLDDQHE